MKKLIKIILLSILFFSFYITYAATDDTQPVEVVVTEKIEGADCDAGKVLDANSGVKTYICKVQPGFNSVLTMIGAIIKYLTALGVLAAVLFIVVNGIQLSMGGLDSKAKEDAKTGIGKAIGGLVFLLLSGVILTMIAPWVYK